jgi:hypothetical protein
MKIQTELSMKRKYSLPQIEQIKLDNEISLALESDAPTGPGDEQIVNVKCFNNNPFDKNLG